MAHLTARVGSARQRLDTNSTWIPGRGRAIARRRERARPWPLPLPQSAPVRVCSLCQHPERTTRGWCPGASSARARGAALQFRLDGSAGHRIVDLLQGGKVVSVLCVVCGLYGGRVVRISLLGNCPAAPTPGRLLALRGFLPRSHRTTRLDSILGDVLRAQSGPCRSRAHFLRFCPPFLSKQRCSEV